MKADPFQIGAMLKDEKRFVVPIYQRTYAWTKEKQLDKLYDSIEAKAKERIANKISKFPHYMGAILLNPRGTFTFGKMPVFDVVDGQQRLTTYQLMLAALRSLAIGISNTPLADKLSGFLFNSDSTMMEYPKIEKYKIQNTKYDRKLFHDLLIMNIDAIREKYSINFYKNGKIRNNAPLPLQAWFYFRTESEEFMYEDSGKNLALRLQALSGALLEDFRVIVITLDESDDAQVIFETLNSGGEPLSAMDLVRNDVFHRAVRQGEDTESLMENSWSTFEDTFWKQEISQGRIKKPRIDFFLAHTLAAETNSEVLMSELYAKYKEFVHNKAFPSIDKEVEAMLCHAKNYKRLTSPEGNDSFAKFARQLNIFEVSTAYPLALVLSNSTAEDEERDTIYKLITSYIVRRALCGLTSKNYNNVFMRLAGFLRENGVSIQAFISKFSDSDGDSVRFPGDYELKNAIKTRSHYDNLPSARLRYILMELEKASRTNFDEMDGLRTDLTIEHIMPQSWAHHWPLNDGSFAPSDCIVSNDDPRHAAISQRQAIKHNIGNLTLLTPEGNPRLGNLPFNAIDPKVGMSKKDALRSSLLRMNQDVAGYENWSEDQILQRADHLANLAIILWPHPRHILETGQFLA
jgi:uncharacterized protein with ParB-like and HNH nuclease domain